MNLGNKANENLAHKKISAKLNGKSGHAAMHCKHRGKGNKLF